ncbi:unnamed protein product [Lymnaea stagnalis]|uniref:Transforming acidic coiled-coil-containing protein C-terminal domain-containing protein n=1 Tax=Lymnaea stagnalis TaxID=6523 RepID=A0AAV2H6C5_LYMST
MFSETDSSLISEPSSISSVCSNNSNGTSLPSYLIVQRQLADVIITQRVAVQQLVQNNIDVLNASRESFNTTVKSQEEKIKALEKTIIEDYVLKEAYELLQTEMKENYVHKEKYEKIQKLFEEEYAKHSETQAKLQDVLEKFDSCLNEISKMEQQMKESNSAFNLACDTLKGELSDAYANNRELGAFLKEKTLQSERQEGIIQQKQARIEELEREKTLQSRKYQQKLTETEIEKQQEAYLYKMLNDVNTKKK